ncbi:MULTISPECIES: RNA polymerase sigma-70 factor [unclassified Paenibacillus]|uniref:RNA polymerase sigma-70 factor n=1 Tax=unclassified Paenibacillus TaxID=185978 RepID=UPI00093EB5F7|nr:MULTISPECIES: RNA polymerase sigma-70 factor [unclassified Paenibacillus]OKP92310.1 RNA polymerase subunit sigma-24 [Paenibacillus sp. P3E]OKP97027.1 RNA polymerase subunit sigma-24 [Paenibacillus sp. P46E]
MQELYEQYKALLFTLAYQLTGSASDAEDVVQDVFLKINDVDLARLVKPRAYLCKMVTNRCRDLFKSARKRRELYFGQWLPEPILTPNDESFEAVVRDELLSYAMLVLLERLSHTERAVFVLREALGFEYSDIAELVDKSEANCRKLFSRARGKMGITRDEQVHSEAASEEWVRRFLKALELGNVDTVVSILAEDVVLVSDGGGKAFAAVRPIESRDPVARFLLGLIRKAPHYEGGVHVEMTDINGQTGLVVRSGEGIEVVVLIHVERNAICNLYFIRNPDKLRHLLK